jgi:hypothetical protein
VAHYLHAEIGAHDAARILRVPGSHHHTTGRVARLEYLSGERHDLDDIIGGLPDLPSYRPPGAHRPTKSTDELVALFENDYAHEDGGRHDPYRSVVGVLLSRCDAMPPDVLLELGVSWAQTHTSPCKDRRELERNFDNLFARELARRGLS